MVDPAACQKVPTGLFDCASAAEHFAWGKMLLSEKPEKSGF
jgi:hypothetical protein